MNENQPMNEMPGQLEEHFMNQRNQIKEVAEEILEVDKILNTIENMIRGKVIEEHFDEESQRWIKTEVQKGEPRLNEDGMRLWLNTLIIYVNKNTILSNLDEVRISNMLKDLMKRLALIIGMNHEKIGIKKNDWIPLLEDTMDLVEIILRRSQDGQTLEMFKKTISVVEQTVKTSNNKRNWIPDMFRGGG